MDRLTEIEAFAAVVELGTFTEAARKLDLSKSAVSKHVSSLEARLGAHLLTRTTRRVAPTDIGLLYYEQVRRVLSEARQAEAMVSDLKAQPKGVLRVAVARDFGTHALSPVLGGFLAQHPDLSINAVLTDQHVELKAERFDVALRLGEPDAGNLRAERIVRSRLCFVAAPSYLHRAGAPTRLEDLPDHGLLHRSDKGGIGSIWQVTVPSGEVRSLRAGGTLMVNDGRFLLNAAISGLGIAYLPAFLCNGALQAGLVEEVLADFPPQVLDLHAIYREEDATRPNLRAFLRFLHETFGNEGTEQHDAIRA